MFTHLLIYWFVFLYVVKTLLIYIISFILVPTFVRFLQDIDSPYEVGDIVAWILFIDLVVMQNMNVI